MKCPFERTWPRSLFGRLTLILFCGLIAAHALSFGLVMYERTSASAAMMLNYLSKDVASGVGILERVPVEERPQWLDRLGRRNYQYALGSMPEVPSKPTELAERIALSLSKVLGPDYSVRALQRPDETRSMTLQLQLKDSTPLSIHISLTAMPISPWVFAVLMAQLLLLVLFSWLAVRVATRPLAQLADAANSLGPGLKGAKLPENGPTEVARAAAAFNAMQCRLSAHHTERMRILAAVSHDLQTPLTRMRLRADLLDDTALRDKLYGDLDSMQALLQEGITYARDAQGVTEPPCCVDLHTFLDSLVCDYVDAGKEVRIAGQCNKEMVTRPHTLRRIITNLLDNALKFGRDPEIVVSVEPANQVSIAVRDQGPGIPDDELDAVLQPFYRLDSGSSRETGGTGLGLAIAQQLAQALNGTLVLSNRSTGGLEARLQLPC
jgi:signal transduction histidine kinase